MSIEKLSINQVRNLAAVSIQLSPQFNFFIGDNGAGKSSILEALHLLSSGRSFRIADIKKVIRHHQDALSVFVQISRPDLESTKVGLARNRQGGFEARVDGESIKRLADAIRLVPVQLISPETFSLLTSGKQARRSYLDWGVFHVEHAFFSVWQQWQKLLKQRNQLLRKREQNSALYRAWDAQYIALANQIHEMRRLYVNSLLESVNGVANAFFPEVKWTFKYDAGWNTEAGLEASLKQHFPRDLQQGFTSVGPHRSSFRLLIDGLPVEQVCSRGQLKLMICCLKLAQGDHLERHTRQKVTYLIDDIESELDSTRRQRVIAWLRDADKQVLTTAINRSAIAPFIVDGDHVFHVEHGEVRQQQECNSTNG